MNQRLSKIKIMMQAVLIGCLSVQTALAADDWNVDGEHGELHVHGMLTEAACVLDMQSAWQAVSLGTIARGALVRPGDRGTPVPFHIRLLRCSRSGGEQPNRYTGTVTQDAIQPVVTLSFTGVSVPHFPALLSVTDVSGMGLLLTDPRGRRLIPGARGEPLMLTPGDNVLTFRVIPVRTTDILTTGNFRAVAGFEVNYD